jgi:hypothetical protein
MPNAKKIYLEFKNVGQTVAIDLLNYIKNPIEGIKNLPHWSFTVTLITQVLISAFFGILSGIIAKKFTYIMSGLIAWPISSLLLTCVISLCFYYLFIFYYKRTVSFKKIYLIVFLSGLASLVLSPLVSLFEPVRILGLILGAFVLIVGLHEHTLLGKMHISRLVFGAILIYTAYWTLQFIQTIATRQDYKKSATQKTLDILEKEMR